MEAADHHQDDQVLRQLTGEITETTAPRLNAFDHLVMVRAFYLDLAQWAADDPARWGPWAAPCPVRDADIAQRGKARSRRKSRMDQRTRERIPVLPALLAKVDAERAGRRRTAARRRGHRARPAVHRGGPDPAPASQGARLSGPDLGARPRRRQAPRPHPGRAPGVLDLGRGAGSAPHRHPDRGTHRAVPPQLHPVQAAGHRRADPAAADRPVQDRHRAAAGHQPRAGRRAQRDHHPDPRPGRHGAAGDRLRLPRTGVEPADAAAVPAPSRRRAPRHRRPRDPRADQRRPGQHRDHRRQRQAAAVRARTTSGGSSSPTRSCTACRRTSPSSSPGTATSASPSATRPSTPRKSSTPTGPSSPAAGRCGPPRNTAPPPTRNGTSSSATSSGASCRWAPAAAPTPPPASTSTPASAARCCAPTPPSGPGWPRSATT